MTRPKVRNKKKYKHSRSYLRSNMPAPEIILWQRLRGQSFGVKFRRQFSIQDYILDFYAPSIKLAIEVDGESHFSDENLKIRDEIRDKELAKYGIRVLRFTNLEVMNNLEGVVLRIIEHLPPLNLPLIMGEKNKVRVRNL